MNTRYLRFKLPRRLLTAAAIAALAACASTPPSNPNLEEARAAYERAALDPAVARSAVRELQVAQQALARAETAQRAGEPAPSVDHLAYLARKRTEVALQISRAAEADRQVADASSQRDRILLQSRTREAQAATQQADAAARATEAQRAVAETQRAAADQARLSAAASREQTAVLAAQLADMQARETERGMVLTLGDVLFDTGKATLKPGAMRTVDQLAQFLQKNSQRKVLIEGYTDSTGSASLNQELSEQRADAVRAALGQRGIGPGRVETHGFGPAYAVASNDTSGGRQMNRRVEVVFSDERGDFRTRRN